MEKIYINPGHSDRDPGAVGYETERKLNVKVCGFMEAHLLENYNCEVRKNPGTQGDLAAVCAEANAWGADLFVSVHFNAGGGDGFECYVYSEARRPLGQIFEKHVKAAGQNSRGVKVKPSFIVLNSTDMPAILNEGAFVDNKTDIADWNEDAELKAMGIAYAEAAAEYLGLAKKTVKEEATVNVTMNVLKKGSAGEQVKVLQRLLHAQGYALGTQNPVDGDFGSKTDSAVRAYQKRSGLTVDGIVGEKTWKKLLAAK